MDKVRVGQSCKAFRERIGKTQKQVSMETGYTIQAISAFENGKASSGVLLLWYMKHGYTYGEYLNYGKD